MEYIWLFYRNEKREMACSVFGSLLFHTLMFAILASTTIFRPLPGDSENVDILWYYPSLSPSEKAVSREKSVAAAKGDEKSLPRKRKTAAAPVVKKRQPPPPVKGKAEAPVAKSTPPPPVAVKEESPPLPAVAPPPVEEPEPLSEPEMTIPASIEPPVEKRIAAIPLEKPPAAKAKAKEAKREDSPLPGQVSGEKIEPVSEENKIVPSEEAKAEVPPSKETPSKPPVRDGAAKTTAAAAPPVAEPAASGPQSASPTRESQSGEAAPVSGPLSPDAAPSSVKGKEEGEGNATESPKPGSKGKMGEEGKGVPAVGKKTVEAPADKTAPATINGGEGQAAATRKGIFFPPVKGDLKLEFAGKEDMLQQIDVVVFFREFGKSRRNRAFTRGEYASVRKTVPRSVRSGEHSRQVVIETAFDGVYEFRIETASSQSVEATFTLKLYDQSNRSRAKPLGSRRISSNEWTVKVLMPEGILWDDDDAFSGSYENSDSVTKFNSETGLLWREYK